MSSDHMTEARKHHDRIRRLTERERIGNARHTMDDQDCTISTDKAVQDMVEEVRAGRVVMFGIANITNALALIDIPPHSTVWLDSGDGEVFKVHDPCPCIIPAVIMASVSNILLYISIDRDADARKMLDNLGFPDDFALGEKTYFVDFMDTPGYMVAFPRTLMAVAEVVDPEFANDVKDAAVEFENDMLGKLLARVADANAQMKENPTMSKEEFLRLVKNEPDPGLATYLQETQPEPGQ